MTAPLDVLATLSLAASYASTNGANATHDALVEARAAVAELVKASRAIATDRAKMHAVEYDPRHLALTAALAKFGGAA